VLVFARMFVGRMVVAGSRAARHKVEGQSRVGIERRVLGIGRKAVVHKAVGCKVAACRFVVARKVVVGRRDVDRRVVGCKAEAAPNMVVPSAADHRDVHN